MPAKTLLRLGLGFIFCALAIYFSLGHWLNSRIFVPLNYSVSLDALQLKSPPFEINLSDIYDVSLDWDYGEDDHYQDDLCRFGTIFDPSWRLYKLRTKRGQERELWASSMKSIKQNLGPRSFQASAGQYQLEWDIPAVASCLNPRHPRLSVATDSSGYREVVGFIRPLCIFLGGTGLVLVVLAFKQTVRYSSDGPAPLRIFPDMILRHWLPLTKHEPLVPMHGLPHWGLFSGAILWIVVFIFMISRPLTGKGLFVTLPNRKTVVSQKSAWRDTLAVYVGPPHRFFVNREEVQRDSLRVKLLEQLNNRVEWSVYFEGDKDSIYMDDVYAIETIQSCGAKLIWITPKIREEWQQKFELENK